MAAKGVVTMELKQYHVVAVLGDKITLRNSGLAGS